MQPINIGYQSQARVVTKRCKNAHKMHMIIALNYLFAVKRAAEPLQKKS